MNFTPTWANSARVVGVKVNAEEQKKNEKISPLSVLEGGDVLVSNLTNVLEVSRDKLLCILTNSKSFLIQCISCKCRFCSINAVVQ